MSKKTGILSLLFVLLASSFYSFKSRAGGETSGGGIIQQFQRFSPEEALQSDLWLHRFRKIQLPNLSEAVSSAKICRDNQQNLVVAEHMEYCAQWVAKLRQNENGKKYSVFKYKFQASAKAKTRTGANEFYCAQKEIDYPTVPIKELVDDCAKWSAFTYDDGVKYFDTLDKATRFVRDYKRSWDPVCEGWGQRVNKMPTTYKVDFHRDGVTLGTYEFKIPSCGAGL